MTGPTGGNTSNADDTTFHNETTSATGSNENEASTTNSGESPESGSNDTTAPPICGDGNADPGEECDLGENLSNAGACLLDCTRAGCNDGFIWVGQEICDDGNMNSEDLCVDCALAVCGDGFVWEGEEDCDDGNREDGDACPRNCTFSEETDASEQNCGDGVVDTLVGEECEHDLTGDITCEDSGLISGLAACDDTCRIDLSACIPPPPDLTLELAAIKQFEFSWSTNDFASYYVLEESWTSGEPFVQIGENLQTTATTAIVPLHLRANATYRVNSCNSTGECSQSAPVSPPLFLSDGVGYFKSSNAEALDDFGMLALDSAGRTLVVAAPNEDSGGSGVNGGSEASNSMEEAGAIYVFSRADSGTWSQAAYIKASNPDADDIFGSSVAISGDGRTIAVGAPSESSASAGINGDQSSNTASHTGAVYIFALNSNEEWVQQAYIKSSNPDARDWFGTAVSLSNNGSILAVGAHGEDSADGGINGNQADDSVSGAGAVYTFARTAGGTWAQQAYIKPASPRDGGSFGQNLTLSGDGRTLAASHRDDSGAVGIDGDDSDTSAESSGAVHVFTRNDLGQWMQQAYVKASNTEADDYFGCDIALSDDGSVLAVGANGEDSASSGINGSQSDNASENSGAAYVFVRSVSMEWSQQAYIKASNVGNGDFFGSFLALDATGQVLGVAAIWEDSAAIGIQGDQGDNSAVDSGAVYTFRRDEDSGQWVPRSYIKAPNTDEYDYFGRGLAFSFNGDVLAVGADGEDSVSRGIGGDQHDDAPLSYYGIGAAYLY